MMPIRDRYMLACGQRTIFSAVDGHFVTLCARMSFQDVSKLLNDFRIAVGATYYYLAGIGLTLWAQNIQTSTEGDPAGIRFPKAVIAD